MAGIDADEHAKAKAKSKADLEVLIPGVFSRKPHVFSFGFGARYSLPW